jgi:hypothetical protein
LREGNIVLAGIIVGLWVLFSVPLSLLLATGMKVCEAASTANLPQRLSQPEEFADANYPVAA